MNIVKKGRAKFTSKEIDTLRELIRQKCNATSTDQKSIRAKMRKMGFHIRDFVEDITSVEEFDQLIATGTIICGDCKEIPSARSIAHHAPQNKIPLIKLANAEKRNRKEGLEAVVGDEPRILILGTLPGDESLQKKEYYAKAGNRFWKVIYGLYGTTEVPKDYEEKEAFLKKHHIAIWDVLSSAEREGSLDVNIMQEIPNNIPAFIEKYPTIKVIAFNGKKAKEKFDEHFSELFDNEKLKIITLLSSSGANNQYSLDEMKRDWSRILN